MRTARDLCDDTGALMIVDEVQTGMGRTGKWFGFQHYRRGAGHHILGEGVWAGASRSAPSSPPEKMAKTFTPGSHGTTFGGNPLACAAGKAVIETMKKEGLVERSAELGDKWNVPSRKIADEKSGVKEVRGMGLMIGIEMGDKAKEFKELGFEKGLLVNVAGGKVIRLVPPLIIAEASVELFNRTLGGFLS